MRKLVNHKYTLSYSVGISRRGSIGGHEYTYFLENKSTIKEVIAFLTKRINEEHPSSYIKQFQYIYTDAKNLEYWYPEFNFAVTNKKSWEWRGSLHAAQLRNHYYQNAKIGPIPLRKQDIIEELLA